MNARLSSAFSVDAPDALGDTQADTPPASSAQTVDEASASSLPLTFAGYVLEHRLGAGGMGEVYVARPPDTDHQVALKILSRVSATNLYRFKREFRALADVDHPNLIRLHELGLADDGHPFFTMEVLDGQPFVDWVRQGVDVDLPPPKGRLVAALRQLVDGLVALHDRNCIHRDLKPSNVLVDRAGRVVILDFGLVSELDDPDRGVTREGQLLGTPAYMAPEQACGLRAGRASDYYAVGVMLYESLTGHKPPTALPFGDHRPIPHLEAALAAAPPTLRRLCIELLDVEPAHRPEAKQIRAALGVESSGSTHGRELGPDEHFVGRETELAALDRAYQDSLADEAPVVVLVRGPSGQGKSTLLRQFRRQLRKDRCLVFHGRCREREHVPYKGVDALVDALSAYLRRLPQHELAALRPRSVKALVQVFPVLDDLWSRAPSQQLGTRDLRSLSWIALAELISGVVERRPLVLQIDDFQWSDVDSLQLLSEMLDASLAPKLLLILAMREDTDTALVRALATNDILGAEARHIDLAPLSLADARTLAEALARDVPGESSKVAALRAESVVLRAGGNPFYIGQLIRETSDSSPSADSDLDVIVAQRLRDLSHSARALLELVALAGRPLDASTALALCEEASPADVRGLREQALLVGGGDADDPATMGRLETAHDRIREVVLAGLSPGHQVRLHKDLGDWLMAHDQPLYDILEHLNRTLEAEHTVDRLWRLATLNLDAGLAGLRSSAPAMAIHHLEAGLRAIEQVDARSPAGRTEAKSALALDLAVQHARCVSLLGGQQRASELFDAIMAAPLSAMGYAQIALVRADVCVTIENHDDAIRWGLDGLERLGLALSPSPNTAAALRALARLRWAFRDSARLSLERLPNCDDPAARLRLQLLAKLVSPAFIVGGNLVPVLIAAAASESLRVGRTPAFGFYLALVGLLFVGALGYYRGAAELADHALRMSEEPEATRRGITMILAHATILHWTRPHLECLAGIETSFELALGEGDLEYATYAVFHRVGFLSALGHPLDEVSTAADEAARFAGQTGLAEFAGVLFVRAQMFDLLTTAGEPSAFDPNVFGLLYPRCAAVTWAIQPLVFLAEPELALAMAETVVDEIANGLAGFYLYPEFVFFHGMAAAMTIDESADSRQLRRILRASQRKLAGWVSVYPDNLGPYASLLEAEGARIRGRIEQAQGLYQDVIGQTSDRAPHIAALACERLGRCMITRGWLDLGHTPLARARQLYGSWGASAKVAALDVEFPELRPT